RRDRLKVTDFGIAHSIGVPSVTQAGLVLGTVPYMAPEQARGEPPAPAADVFAAGAVLFEMLSGRLPFPGASVAEVARPRVRGRGPAAWSGSPVSPALRSIVERCLAPDPKARFVSAAALGRALSDLQAVAGQATRRVPADVAQMRPDPPVIPPR